MADQAETKRHNSKRLFAGVFIAVIIVLVFAVLQFAESDKHSGTAQKQRAVELTYSPLKVQ